MFPRNPTDPFTVAAGYIHQFILIGWIEFVPFLLYNLNGNILGLKFYS